MQTNKMSIVERYSDRVLLGRERLGCFALKVGAGGVAPSVHFDGVAWKSLECISGPFQARNNIITIFSKHYQCPNLSTIEKPSCNLPR